MQQKYYFDTSIWLDIYEKRGDNGELAMKLLTKIIEENFKIAYSDLNVKEFKKLRYTQHNINTIFSVAKPNNIKHVHIHRKQTKEARKIARQRNVPRKDALHAIIARDNDLQLIATDPHFQKLKDITKAKKPADFI